MSQNSEILKHLKRRGITPLQALNLYGCLRLAARIKDLKKLGHTIKTVMQYKGGKKWAKYIFVRPV